ncbi:hypothetical protein [Catenuloplanes japonicus]|uniref:hypothetical protein n=1 Tax=Catenuloplanes japonicus TaxID=33876 RepID=UPI0012F82A83|nr:hypothetical protein [Catenuloplanes japonicus]
MRALRGLVVVTTLAAVLVMNVSAQSSAATDPVITVRTAVAVGAVPADFLGANHRYPLDGYGVWDTAGDRPDPGAVARTRAAGVRMLRWPGGTVANTTLWKGTIGDSRVCQRDGRVQDLGDAANPADDVLIGQYPAYGLVEHLRFAAAVGAQTQIMVPMAIGTATDAADLVEYLNTPAGDGINPNGGVDWAELRPDDHPQPYGITRWELGNENYHAGQRYWMSQDTDEALRQYITGGSRRIENERLGKLCGAATGPVASDGTAHQVFDLNYPTADPGDFVLRAGGTTWTRVGSLDGASASATVFVLNEFRGTVTFGDGTHGAIPPKGTSLVASYTSTHKGYVEFRAAMRAVDPGLEVCASWGRATFAPAFERLKGNAIPAGSSFDCLTTHPYTHFSGGGMADWDSIGEAHDWQMIGAADAVRKFEAIRASAGGKSVAISESGALWGPDGGGAYPQYTFAMTHALYLASQWIDWLELGVPWVQANDLSSEGMYTLLGRSGTVVSAEARVREAVTPVFAPGGRRLANSVAGNPRRSTDRPEMCDGAGTPQDLCAAGYDKLAVTAVRAADGTVHVMVVNRSPLPAETIHARIALDGFTTDGHAAVRQVAPPRFDSANTAAAPDAVTLHTFCRAVAAHGLDVDLPAHSVTVFSMSPDGGPVTC